MKDVKLPDLSKLKSVKKRLEKLPPQISAEDTSNWENRNISAPSIKAPRRFHMIRSKSNGDDGSSLTADQLDKLIEANKNAKKTAN